MIAAGRVQLLALIAAARAALIALLALALIALIAAAGCDPLPDPAADAGGIDARRATSRVLHLGAAAFVADAGLGRLSQFGFLSTVAVAVPSAPVPLPAGTVLESITIRYDRRDTGAVQPRIRRLDPAAGSSTLVWSGADDNLSAGIASQTAALGAAMLASDLYTVEALMTGAGCRLWGAVVEYREAP